MPTHDKRDLVITWVRQCFLAAGVEATDKEARDFASTAVGEIIEEGFLSFAEGNSVPHGTGSHTVAGGIPVPGFVAYVNRRVPQDDESRLEAFDEIFGRFVELTATAEADGERGPAANAAYNRSLNAANEILEQCFLTHSEDFAQKLHQAFGRKDSEGVDLSRITVGKSVTSGCLIAVLMLSATALVVARARGTVLKRRRLTSHTRRFGSCGPV